MNFTVDFFCNIYLQKRSQKALKNLRKLAHNLPQNHNPRVFTVKSYLAMLLIILYKQFR